MTTYLEPVYDSAKSFYKKATVEFHGDEVILYSYGTKVCVINRLKKTAEILGFHSQTTSRHIKDFLYQNSFKVGSRQFMYETYTKAGRQEVIDKEQKLIEKEKAKIEKAILKEKEKEAKKIEKEKLKQSLIKELGDVCSKSEINRLVSIELKNN